MFKNYKPGKYTSYMLFFLPLFFALFMNFSREADTWFLLSHGRYVLENGIPYTEILSMHSNFSFIMQQWLSSTIFYLIYKTFGEIGFYIFYLIINAVITYLIYKLCMVITNKKIYASTITSVLCMVILQLNFIEVRPQIFSYIILLILMIILEEFYKNEKSRLIYLLPVVSLLLINLHAAFFPIFIIVCMPFLFEYFINKDKRLIKLVVLIIIGIIVSLINPYGIKALMYGLQSYGVGNTNSFIIEMAPFNLLGKNNKEYLLFLCIFLLVNLVMILFGNKKKYNIHMILFIYGFFVMGLLAFKNTGFYYLLAMPFMSKIINVEDGVEEKLPYKTYLILGVILIAFLGYKIYDKEYVLKSGIEDVINYLDNNANKNISLYTDYKNGSYVEFYGYKPYIDTRAEVFIKKNNKKEDILDEYFKLYLGELDMRKFTDKYKFDYILVNKYDEYYKYIKKCSDYELVYKGKDKITFIFKRNI